MMKIGDRENRSWTGEAPLEGTAFGVLMCARLEQRFALLSLSLLQYSWR